MEQRFGHDFSGVRIHADFRAAESAHAVAAKAYTVGHNVVFGQGHYAPATSAGKRLFAHELAHVVQQQTGRTSAPPTERHEREADAIADTISQSGNSVVVSEASGTGIARAPVDPPRPLVPHVTNEIEQRLIILLGRERDQLGATSFQQALTRTAAAAAIIRPNGEVIYVSDLSSDKLHAEEKLLPRIEKIVKPGDTVALAIDADTPCGPNSKDCATRVNTYRDNPAHGNLRVYAVSSTTKSGKEAGAKTTVVFSRPPIEQRHLRPLSEFNRTRLPLVNQPRGAPPSPSSPGAPTGPVAPQSGPQTATSSAPTGASATAASPALSSAKIAIALQGQIGKLAGQTPNIVRFAGLIKGGLAVLGLVQQVASAVKLGATLKSATEALEHDDFQRAENELRAVGDDRVQNAAEQLRSHAADILRESEGVWNSVSLVELAILESQLEAIHDSERLFELSAAAGDFAFEASIPIPSLRSSAHDIPLMATAAHMLSKFCEKVVEFPGPDVLALKAKFWGLSVSTEAAGNKFDNAAQDYGQALAFAEQLASGAQAIGHKANTAAWRISAERSAADRDAQGPAPKPSLASSQPSTRTSTAARPSPKSDRAPDCHGSGACHTRAKDPSVLDRLTDDMRSRDDKAARDWLEPK